MKGFTNLYFSIFIGLGILFIPFSWNLFSFQTTVTTFIFADFVSSIANLFGLSIGLLDFSSDSKSLYFLMFIFSVLSIIISFSLLKFTSEINRQKIISLILTLATYYLAVLLLKYGFDKLFKAQFNLPEPNLLYIPMGKLDKDILYWSTMGSSYSYNLFMGFAEVVPAILILIKPTRNLGLLISFGVLINVFAVNLSFDISVKLLSGFLLFINGFLAFPIVKKVWSILVLKTWISEPKLKSLQHNHWYYIFLKAAFSVLISVEIFLPYIRTSNFQDDLAPRPYLHGAYEVQSILSKGDTLNTKQPAIKRIFIHRDGYLIFQNQNDEMTDYHIEIDKNEKKLLLTDYNGHEQIIHYRYNSIDSLLSLTYSGDQTSKMLNAKVIEWKKLPLLQKQFHWTVD